MSKNDTARNSRIGRGIFRGILALSLCFTVPVCSGCSGTADNSSVPEDTAEIVITQRSSLPEGEWQAEVHFPVQSFELFVNNHPMDTSDMTAGVYEIDTGAIAKAGINTIQVSGIVPADLKDAVTVCIPYPVVIENDPQETVIDPAAFNLISRIIEADIRNGFSSAQLAVVKDGKIIFQNAWGQVSSYESDGTRIENGIRVTNDTLYDLASNTKMYAAAYAVMYLTDRGLLHLEDRIVDLIGTRFVDDTMEIPFAAYGNSYPGLETIRKWKAGLTVKDVMMHRAGFPDSGHYHNDKFDAVNQKLTLSTDHVLYIENADTQKTLDEGICRTPLIYQPGMKTLYSDIDYMLLGIIVEKVTGQDLNEFLSETFWKPMGLEHITYNPLEHGFRKEDCAATELNGNTRDGLIRFPGVRTGVLQGEVHDEECFYMMDGESGHAGLFANASDLAKLASVMLTGGYGNTRFFSKNTRDLFIAPQAGSLPTYGIGWWREADDGRVWYFGTQSPESTTGHQGWTGTLTMIDYENNLVVVYLTNSINTPVWNPADLTHANDFAGRYYTSSTLGFVPQILYAGMGQTGADPGPALAALMEDMVNSKRRIVHQLEEKNGGPLEEEHPAVRALKALEECITENKDNQ